MTDPFDLANRVAALEARLQAIPPQSQSTTLLSMNEDVSFSGPRTTGDALVYDGTIHAFTNTPATGTPKTDYFLDPTGTSLANGGLFTWVTAASVYPASDGVLDLSTPTIPTVVAAGLITFDITVDLAAAIGLPNQRVAGAIGRGGVTLCGQLTPFINDATNTNLNQTCFSMSAYCQPGDTVVVVVQNGAPGSNSPYQLNATVTQMQ